VQGKDIDKGITHRRPSSSSKRLTTEGAYDWHDAFTGNLVTPMPTAAHSCRGPGVRRRAGKQVPEADDWNLAGDSQGRFADPRTSVHLPNTHSRAAADVGTDANGVYAFDTVSRDAMSDPDGKPQARISCSGRVRARHAARHLYADLSRREGQRSRIPVLALVRPRGRQ